MRDDQLFGAVAGLALLIWLLGRGFSPDPRWRRRTEALALGMVAAAVLYALFRTIVWFVS